MLWKFREKIWKGVVSVMGKPTGFLDFERKNNKAVEPLERIKNFNEFHTPMSEKD